MSTLPAVNVPPRKSFAQVAAAANVPIIPKEKPNNKKIQNLNEQSSPQPHNGLSVTRVETDTRRNVNGINTLPPFVPPCGQEAEKADQLAGLLKEIRLQDGTSQVPSSDQLLKKESDTKSVASRTTLTLDEKESLRPDDSASMQAAIEEDAFSPSGSVVAGSREGSDPDARAFRDQLHVIDRTSGPVLVSQRDVAAAVPPKADIRNGGIIFATPPAVPSPFNHLEAAGVEQPRGSTTGLVIPPDEKLLEALASPKDRLFVLKIEQDMIDFVRDSKEEFLQLPQTNSFYRMLSHKLADYYLLGHLIDDSMTSVRIYRTPHSRLPPPLMGSNSSADGSTPPPTAPARKIMRRGAEGYSRQSQNGDLKSFYSQTSSKTTSDNGVASGGDEGNDFLIKGKDKSALTREERENRYKEARARIFKDFKEEPAENTDLVGSTNDKEVSRSSSTSGVKKSKKQKKQKDDGFEARSVYSQYGNQPFSSNGLTQGPANGSFYNPFTPYAIPGPTAAQNQSFENDPPAVAPSYPPYNQPSPSGVGNWPGQYPAQGYPIPQNPPSSNFPGPDNYHTGNVFAGSLHSYPSPNTASQSTPKLAAAPLVGFSGDYMSQNDHMAWPQSPFNNPYGMPTMTYSNTGYSDSGFPGQHMMYSTPAGAYGGFQPHESQHHGQQSPYNNFARQQFNPRSQAFVPATRGGAPQSVYPNLSGPFGMNASHYHNADPLQRQVSSTSQSSGFNPPHFLQSSPNGNNHMNGHGPIRSQVQNPRNPQQSFQSSISKWGTPSTLPAKPPPPAISSPFFEVPKDPQNQQPLPPNPYTNGSRPLSSNNIAINTQR